jgi:hypothetical protein
MSNNGSLETVVEYIRNTRFAPLNYLFRRDYSKSINARWYHGYRSQNRIVLVRKDRKESMYYVRLESFKLFEISE